MPISEKKVWISTPGPSRRAMRNYVRWQDYKATGRFSDKPRPSSGHSIMLLRGNRTLTIDAVYQADDQQFRNWIRAKHQIDLDPDIEISKSDRIQLLKSLVNGQG